MAIRQHVSQLEEVPAPEETSQTTDGKAGIGEDTPISEMQDLNELSIMLGFEKGFDGSDPEFIYQWAKEFTGEPAGPKVLGHIKATVKMLGTTEKGPQLLRRLNMFAKLDSRQNKIQLQKENLYV